MADFQDVKPQLHYCNKQTIDHYKLSSQEQYIAKLILLKFIYFFLVQE